MLKNAGNKSMKRLIMCLTLCLVGQAQVWAAPQAVTNTQMTQARAVQLAADFCARIGIDATMPVKAIFPATDVVEYSPLSWQPRWKITFKNQVEVDLVDATGLVCGFSNYAPGDKLAWDRTPPGNAIPEAEAIEKASSLLQATEQFRELGLPTAHLIQFSYVPMMASHQWIVAFPRVFQGIPYNDQQATVLLQAETGDLIGFGIVFSSPAPLSASMNMGVEQAASIASNLLGLSNMPDVVLDSVQTQIVRPNTYWQPGGAEEHKLQGPARVARVVRFKAGDETREIWIDTETGQVIGGSDSSIMGSSRRALPAGGPLLVGKAMQAAQEVRIYRANSKGTGWQPAPSLVLNAHSQPKFFSQLKAAHSITESKPLPGSAEYKFVVYSKSRVISNYVDTGGYIGNIKQWVSVPPSIQSVLNKTPSASPAK